MATNPHSTTLQDVYQVMGVDADAYKAGVQAQESANARQRKQLLQVVGGGAHELNRGSIGFLCETSTKSGDFSAEETRQVDLGLVVAGSAHRVCRWIRIACVR